VASKAIHFIPVANFLTDSDCVNEIPEIWPRVSLTSETLYTMYIQFHPDLPWIAHRALGQSSVDFFLPYSDLMRSVGQLDTKYIVRPTYQFLTVDIKSSRLSDCACLFQWPPLALCKEDCPYRVTKHQTVTVQPVNYSFYARN
jgi:hypothetical protein